MSSSSPESTINRMISERRDKANALRDAGLNPYGNGFVPTHRCKEIRSRYEGTKPEVHPGKGIHPVDGETIRLAGRVMAKRGFGKTVFAPIRDESGDMQLFINVDHLAEEDFKEVKPRMDAGDIVGAEGVIFWTKRGEMSLLCKRLIVLTKSLRPLPEKWHGLTDVELRYRQRYLDLAVNPEVRDVFRKRSLMVRSIRSFLDSRGFLEVETPMMHPTVGGAAARPFTTHHNALDMSLFMRIAPELYLKRLVVGGFERVYEINRNFRNEGISRSHNPEFTMLEFYQAYATYEDLMELTEELVVDLAVELNGVTSVKWDDADIELKRPWKRISVIDAVVQLAGQNQSLFDDPVMAAQAAVEAGVDPEQVAFALIESITVEQSKEVQKEILSGEGLLSKAFRDPQRRPALAKAICERISTEEKRVRAAHLGYLIFDEVVESQLIQPTFLTDFPLSVSPLARKKESDPAFCDRFELFAGGREIANAFSELNDPDDQRSRFVAQVQAKDQGADETMDYDEDYCRALEIGMPPTAGEGIGIDRLAMMLTGQSSIRDVILFPLMRPE